MATPGVGHKGRLQIGKESTYGTAVTATDEFELVSWNVAGSGGLARDRSLNASSISRRSLSPAGTVFRGSFTIRGNYDGMNKLLNAATILAGVGTAGTPYTATFKETSAYTSYTIYLVPGGTIGTTTQYRLKGAYITGLTVRCAANSGDDGMMTWEFDVIAPTVDVLTSAVTSLSPPAAHPIAFSNTGTHSLGVGESAQNTRIKSFEVSIKQPFTDDRFYIGSNAADDPVRNDYATVQWRFNCELTTTKPLELFIAGTAITPSLLFNQPSTTRSFQVSSGTAYISEVSTPIESYGVIPLTFSAEAQYNSSDASALVVVAKTLTQTTL